MVVIPDYGDRGSLQNTENSFHIDMADRPKKPHSTVTGGIT